jgi:hypothetical protein
MVVSIKIWRKKIFNLNFAKRRFLGEPLTSFGSGYPLHHALARFAVSRVVPLLSLSLLASLAMKNEASSERDRSGTTEATACEAGRREGDGADSPTRGAYAPKRLAPKPKIENLVY